MRKILIFSLLTSFCWLAPFHSTNNVQAQDRSRSRLHVSGTVVGIGGRLGGRSRQFTLIANSYTAPNQVTELTQALGRGGQDEMLRVLSRMNAGRIQIGTGIGVPANVVISEPWGDGGTKLTVFYERNVSFYELRHGTRSENYRIGYAEIFLDQQGKGAGTLIAAARIRLKDGTTWEVEDFGTFPARLLGLRATGQVLPR